jgi:hypothetical protein
MNWLNKIREVLCSSIAFIMVYSYAAAVLITDKENFMLVVLFFMFCLSLGLAILFTDFSNYEHIIRILTVPEVTK